MAILVFGHKNPDTDSICSAIGLAHLLQKLGKEAEAVRLGAINAETSYALNKFNAAPIREIDSIEPHARIALVDHNERTQTVTGIMDARIELVVDHHRVAKFQTDEPLYMLVKPVGATATIIAELYTYFSVPFTPEIAGLLLSAIISDTLLLSSPTSTIQDGDMANELAAQAEVDLQEYGRELLQAGIAIDEKSPEALLNVDAKTFELRGHTIRIAQINVLDLTSAAEHFAGLLNAMEVEMQLGSYDMFLTLVTDIIGKNSKLLVKGDTEQIESIFDTTVAHEIADLPGVVSRKKQIVPFLQQAFE